MGLQVQPVDFTEACAFVKTLHRHHRPPLGSKLQIGVNDGEKLVGVIIAGRPVARMLDDGLTLEVTRCCTDGTRNACSILYAHAWKAGRALGYRRMVTYTLPSEGGASLKAAGWVCVGEAEGGKWTRPSRQANDDWPLCSKWRWEVTDAAERKRIRLASGKAEEATLFDGMEEG
jgi:hypothetical protein